jgi:hypothetical protein
MLQNLVRTSSVSLYRPLGLGIKHVREWTLAQHYLLIVAFSFWHSLQLGNATLGLLWT